MTKFPSTAVLAVYGMPDLPTCLPQTHSFYLHASDWCGLSLYVLHPILTWFVQGFASRDLHPASNQVSPSIIYYGKNPYPLRNCILPDEAAVRAQESRGCRPSGSWSPGTYWVGNYVISQWVCPLAFIPWPMRMWVTGCWEIVHFPTPLFHWFKHRSLDNTAVYATTSHMWPLIGTELVVL